MNYPKNCIDFEQYGAIGYAVVEKDAIWIPAIMITKDGSRMRDILKKLHERTGLNRIIFSAVLSPFLKAKLNNIVREWDEWFEQAGDYSHCIEIRYEEPV